MRWNRSRPSARGRCACGSSPISSCIARDDQGQDRYYHRAMSYPLLETIDDPSDLRRLDRRGLAQVATELRAFILDSVSATGGHLSSNLGTVELTIALHYVFRTPEERLVWAVRPPADGPKIPTGPPQKMRQ